MMEVLFWKPSIHLGFSGNIDDSTSILVMLGKFILFWDHEKLLLQKNFKNRINIRRLDGQHMLNIQEVRMTGKLYSYTFINFVLVLIYPWWYHKNRLDNMSLMIEEIQISGDSTIMWSNYIMLSHNLLFSISDSVNFFLF